MEYKGYFTASLPFRSNNSIMTMHSMTQPPDFSMRLQAALRLPVKYKKKVAVIFKRLILLQFINHYLQ